MSAPAFAAVCAEIARTGGWIPFDRYLETVLHDARAGFYGSGRVQFGGNGDFITAPGMSPLFGKMLARQTAQILRAAGGGVLELGAGDGRLAAQLIAELRAQNIPCEYYILETSAALQKRQRETLAGENAVWISALPDNFCGAVIANEVLDAAPFLLFAKRRGEWRARGVALANGALQWEERPAEKNELTARLASLNLPDDYITEICPRAEALTASVCEMLQTGAFIAADYGFGRAEYYHPQRAAGTLMCHCRGRADSEPLAEPGEKDITAHVDFTAIAEAGTDAGAALAGYTSQAHFLLNCGIAEVLQKKSESSDAVQYAKLAAGAQKLLAPHEMGELFKFIAFAKGNIPPLIGFASGSRERQL
ncbi:MAG: class I SAM-dependent methyltransferase [Gammaproteobacteria bacterium]